MPFGSERLVSSAFDLLHQVVAASDYLGAELGMLGSSMAMVKGH
jgi:hypothetical protein